MSVPVRRIIGPVVTAGLVLAAGLVIDARSTLAAWLVAWIALGAIAIGVLPLVMTSYLVRRAWTESLHPIFIGMASALPVVGIGLVPVLIGMRELYPAASETAALPSFKAVYLAPWFLIVRSLVYFVIWTALAVWVRNAWANSERMVRAASAGLIVWTLTVSLAGVDWLESLEPDFHSSVYGLLYVSFTLLSATAFAILGGLLTGRLAGPRGGYGGLLLSVILLWGYLHAMQYIVIWSGDIPDEAIWYIKRSQHGWQFAILVLAAGQFIFPFFALLSGHVRASWRWLLSLCALTLTMRGLEAAILILPATEHIAPATTAIMLVAAFAFLGAVLVWTIEAAFGRGAGSLNPTGRPARVETEGRSGTAARPS